MHVPEFSSDNYREKKRENREFKEQAKLRGMTPEEFRDYREKNYAKIKDAENRERLDRAREMALAEDALRKSSLQEKHPRAPKGPAWPELTDDRLQVPEKPVPGSFGQAKIFELEDGRYRVELPVKDPSKQKVSMTFEDYDDALNAIDVWRQGE